MAGMLVNLPPDIVPAETLRGRILVVDDEPDIRESFAGSALAGRLSGGACRQCHRRPEAPGNQPLRPGASGPDDARQKRHVQVLEEIRARDEDTPVFMITAYGSIEVAIDAEAWRHRLFSEALGQPEAADRDRPHDRLAPPGAREH